MKLNLPITLAAATISMAIPAWTWSTSGSLFATQEPQEKAKEINAVVDKFDAINPHVDSLRRLQTGTAMPPFALTGMDGKLIQSKDYEGRTLILIYLSAEQRNSEHAAADANRILKKYSDSALDLLLVSADKNHREYFATLLKEAHLNIPLAFDDGHKLYSELGLIAFPTTLLIRPDGVLDHVILTRRSDYSHLLDTFVAHALGKIDSDTMEQRLVAPTMTRSSAKTLAQRHREAARLLRDNELYEGAEEELILAVELDPKSTPIRVDLADLYVALRRFDEAESTINTILADDDDHRGARLLLGILRFHTDQLDAAETILNEALIMNPDPERTHYYLGRIYEARGDQSKAIFHYRQALDRMVEN